MRNAVTVSCFPRGFDPKDRKWDPERLLLGRSSSLAIQPVSRDVISLVLSSGYWHSSATLNYLRGYAACGDHQPLQAVQARSCTVTKIWKSCGRLSLCLNRHTDRHGHGFGPTPPPTHPHACTHARMHARPRAYLPGHPPMRKVNVAQYARMSCRLTISN